MVRRFVIKIVKVPHMKVQKPSRFEFLRTFIALIRQFIVYVRVHFQIDALRVPFPAYFARERFFARVDKGMAF